MSYSALKAAGEEKKDLKEHNFFCSPEEKYFMSVLTLWEMHSSRKDDDIQLFYFLYLIDSVIITSISPFKYYLNILSQIINF